MLRRPGFRCKTQKCLLEPFAELRKVWWSCKLCLSMLSENKTTKVRLAAFINVIEYVFKMSCLIDKICWCCCYGMTSEFRVMVDSFNDGLLDVCQEWGLNQGRCYLARVSKDEECSDGWRWNVMRKLDENEDGEYALTSNWTQILWVGL